MKVIVLLAVIALLSTSVYSRQVKWTGQGGTNLWDFGRNWDSGNVPTAADDVIIDVPFAQSSVRIGGSGAVANSLQVGGTSSFTQSLYVQGPLTVGTGGGRIASNGFVVLDSAPSQPFSSAGPFNGASNLQFNSGALAGTGTFTFNYLNLTGPALKVFNASSVSISYLLEVLPGSAATGVVNVGGVLNIQAGATFSTVEALTLTVSPGGSFNVEGAVVFAATGASKTFTFRGYTNAKNVTVTGGNVVINDNVQFGLIDVASGGSLTLIGAQTTSRTFNDLQGAGTIIVQGGTNVFNKMNAAGTVQLQSGILSTNSLININALQVTGGVLQGGGQAQVTQAILANAVFNSISVTVGTLTLNGYTSMNTSTVTTTKAGIVQTSSQLTMSGSSVFWVKSGASFSQGSPMKVVPAGPATSTLRNDGAWTSTSTFATVVAVQGTGAWDLGSGSAFSVTGVPFVAKSLSLSSASFNAQNAQVQVESVQGSSYGVINFQGATFNTGVLNAYVFNHNGGETQFSTGTVSNLTVNSGNVNVTQAATITNIDFVGGSVNGNSTGRTQVSSTSTVVESGTPKYLNNIDITSTAISFLCPNTSCQFFTVNSILQTGPKQLE